MTTQSTRTRPHARLPATARSKRQAGVGFVLALWGALSSFIPIVNLAGDVLAAVGVIFAVSALVSSQRWGAGRALSIAAISLAVIALTVSVVVNIAATEVVSAFATPARALGLVHRSKPAIPAAPSTSSALATPARPAPARPAIQAAVFAPPGAWAADLPTRAPATAPGHPPRPRTPATAQVPGPARILTANLTAFSGGATPRWTHYPLSAYPLSA